MPRRAFPAAILLTGLLALGACGPSTDAGSAAQGTGTTVGPGGTPAPAGTSSLPEDPHAVAPPVTIDAAGWHHRVAEGVTTPAVPIYAHPGEGEPARTLPNPRPINDNPRTTVPLVMNVIREANGWIEVSLPVRPNGSTGWVHSSDVKVTGHNFHVDVDLSGFALKVFEGNDVVLDARIGVASDNYPTPGGTYYITELIKTSNPNGAYGPYAFGLSGYSDVLTTFAGGPGQLAIHGTNEPQRIGTKVSHGCVRVRNDDIVAMVKLGLPLGTPVTIEP
jgi:lipoprotein-anchoring transpeptidase ErfK/SrfK